MVRRIEAVQNNEDKFLSFNKNGQNGLKLLRFADTFKFMTCSIDSLSSDLKKLENITFCLR